MNKNKNLILSKGEDITDDVKSIKYNPATQRCDVTFNNGATYPYSHNSIEWIKTPVVLNVMEKLSNPNYDLGFLVAYLKKA